jgi:hypothetical protein
MGRGTASVRWLATFAGIAPLAGPAFAGAWTPGAGVQQTFVTVSREENDFGEVWRSDAFSEHGFGGGWALNLKVENETRIETSQDDHTGFRLGLQKSFGLGDRASVSVSATYLGGESLDGPDCLGEGYEMRAAVGTSFALGGREGFVNLEGASKTRNDCTRETLEIASGIEFAPKWKFVAKAWSEKESFADSVKAEANLLRDFGPLTVGLGWREEVSGEFEEKGWVVSAWSKF